MLKRSIEKLALICFVMIAGCSGAEQAGRKDVHPVSGKVTLSGSPVAGATVVFSPKEGQPVATAMSDGQGNYKLKTYEAEDGAAVGEYTVLITKTAPSTAPPGPAAHDPQNPTAGAAMHAAQKNAPPKDGSALPEKYSQLGQSDLKAKVEAKSNVFDFPLMP